MTVVDALILVLCLMTLLAMGCLFAFGLHYHRRVLHKRFTEDPDLPDSPLVITEENGEVFIQSLDHDARYHLGHVDESA